jgi:hypothetical protein
MENEMTDAAARAALADIERGRQQVVDEIDMPRWYWWGLAVGWIGVGVATDVNNAWLTGIATLVFGAVHASVAHRVLGGRRRTPQLSVRADVAGRHTPLLVILGLLALAAVTVVVALVASAAGSGHPATIAGVVVAVVILLGGPRCMAAVRRQAVRSSSAR